jgi:hypothetical protein
MEYIANGNGISIVEGKSFIFVMPQEGYTISHLPTIVRLDKPLHFLGPDSSGWSSSSPELPAQKMKNWRERIDAIEFGRRHAFLIFKIETSARQFSPSSVWF